MDNVLVTGGAGYIGSHACKALASAGYNPVVFDNLDTGHPDLVKWGPLVKGDLRNREALIAVMEKYSPVAVLHFAAHACVAESLADPGKYYDNNVHGSLVLLEAMQAVKLNKIVFSGSCACYGTPETLPVFENAPQNPVSPYGRTKWIVEQLIRDFEAANGTGWVSLRYFNAAGADADLETGERHNPETHLIPLALEAIEGKSLQIFGDNHDTPDGTCIRDYVHVTDLAAAHVRALDYLLKNGVSTAFNLGTGRGYSVLQIIKSIEQVTGRPVRFEIGPARAGDPAQLVANSDLANTTLQWRPVHSDLSNIVRTAWQWYQLDARSSMALASRQLATGRS